MNVYCGYCGATNAANARFCRVCRKLIALPGAHTVLRPPLPPAGEYNAPGDWAPRPPVPAPWALPVAPPAGTRQAPPSPWARPTAPYTPSAGWHGRPAGEGAPPAPFMAGAPLAPVMAGAGPAPLVPRMPAGVTAGYRIDPASGLPYDPYFQLEPLPEQPRAGMPAAFFPRLGALLVDYCILSVLWFCVVGVAALIDSTALGMLATLLGPALYFVAFWALGGRTPGYRAAGLRLVHTDGSRVGAGASIVRYVGSLISWPLFCLGYLWMLWDPRAQTWHDKMADTQLIQT